MYRNKQIAIVLSDTLRSFGLQNLLTDYFAPVEVNRFTSFENLASAENSDTYDFYFIEPDIFILNTDFFLPRRNKTIVLVERGGKEDSSINYLRVCASEECIIEHLQELLNNEPNNSYSENNKDLSSREIEVLQLIVKGITNKEIADKLNISLNTVLTHRKNLTAKLGIKTVSGLTFYAIMNGLISGDDITL